MRFSINLRNMFLNFKRKFAFDIMIVDLQQTFRMGKYSKPENSTDGQMSRKEKRKLLRKGKKQRKNAFYHKNIENQSQPQLNKNSKNMYVKGQSIGRISTGSNKDHKEYQKKTLGNQIKLKSSKGQQKKQGINLGKKKGASQQKAKKSKKELQYQDEILREQKQIQYYGKLLGVDKKKNNLKGIAKGLGYEEDLFDFLDNISKKVKGGGKYSEKTKKRGNNQEDQQQEMDISQQQHSDFMDSQMQDQSQLSGEQNDGKFNEGYDEQGLQGEDQGEGLSGQIEEQDQDENCEDEINEQNSGHFEEGDEFQDQEDKSGNQFDSQSMDEQFQDDNMDEEEMAMWQQLDNEGKQTHQQSQNSKKKQKNKLITSQNDKLKLQKSNIQPTHSFKTKPSAQPPNQKDTSPNNPHNPQSKVEGRPQLFANMTPDQKEQQQIRKQMNSIFNKLSDGNLMISFRQFSEIFLSASKGATIPIFINLFIRFNVEVQKPHLHILLSNISLASALHHMMGNRLMAPLIYELIKKFIEYQNTPDDEEEVQEIGYSKIFERKKNVILFFSYLYDFGSLTGDFIYSLVKHLAQSLNSHNVEFLYVFIQKIGSKIRQNDPGILKQIIQTLRSSIQSFKNSQIDQQNQLSKINIIEIELNELKFNRKQPLFSDQRMAFFSTFLTKNIPKQLNTEKQVLLPNFEQIRLANVSRTNWWENLEQTNQNANIGIQDNEHDLQMINELTSERKQLIELAKSLNLVTEIRKNIFVQIMEASDYIEATQRVLSLKIKNLQQIAVVLVQACVLQPTFNPFYPLVAAKISNINPKFKSKVQFTIWDHIKLLESYDARKTSNIAKFSARYIGSVLTNGSLSILKYFPDFINVHPSEAMFLMIFFSEFLAVAKKQTLAQISSKLKEQSNRQIKDAVLEYLKQVGVREKGFNNMEKMKFLRRMIMLNERQNEDEERF